MGIDRRLARGASTRGRLVESAWQLFGRDGYERTSVEAILTHSGVARGALYHHFATKEALFDAVLDRVVAAIAEQIGDAARAARDPVLALRSGCTRWLHLAQDPAIRQVVLVDAPVVVGWQRWRELDERHTLGGVRASLWQLAKAGRIPKTDVDMLANMVLAAVNEAAMVTVNTDDSKRALRKALRALNTLIDRLVDTENTATS